MRRMTIRARKEALIALLRERYDAAVRHHEYGALAQLARDTGIDQPTITKIGQRKRSGLSAERVDAVYRRWAPFRERMGEAATPPSPPKPPPPSSEALERADGLLMAAMQSAAVGLHGDDVARAREAALGCSSVHDRALAISLLGTFLRGLAVERQTPPRPVRLRAER